MSEDIRLTTWRPLSLKQKVRVSSRCKAYTGFTGVIVQVMEQRVDGLSRYAVRLDNCPDRITDFRRFELTRFKPKKARAT